MMVRIAGRPQHHWLMAVTIELRSLLQLIHPAMIIVVTLPYISHARARLQSPLLPAAVLGNAAIAII